MSEDYQEIAEQNQKEFEERLAVFGISVYLDEDLVFPDGVTFGRNFGGGPLYKIMPGSPEAESRKRLDAETRGSH